MGDLIGIFIHFLAQQREQIQRRRARGMASPLGKWCVGRTATRTECFEGSEKQRAVTSHRECRLFRYRDAIPKLGLADPQRVLLLAMIHFNLPAVEIDLQELSDR